MNVDCPFKNSQVNEILSQLFSGQPYSFLPTVTSDLPQPEVLSKSETFNAQIGDTVILPCKVRNLGPMILLWKKGTRVLTAGEMMIRRDERINLKGTVYKYKM